MKSSQPGDVGQERGQELDITAERDEYFGWLDITTERDEYFGGSTSRRSVMSTLVARHHGGA